MTITAVPDKTTEAQPGEMSGPSATAPTPSRVRHRPSPVKAGETVRPTGLTAAVGLGRRLLLFLAGAAAIFGGVESGLWLTEDDADHEPEFLRRQPAPYIEFYSEPDYHGGGVETNAAGFRYGPLPVAKPTGETRIFLLSSSVGFRGATNETTIAGFMEQQLTPLAKSSRRRIRVINASGTSFCPTQSLVLLVTRVLAYEPDVIVVFHGPEALLYPSVYESRPGYPFNFRVRERLHDELAGNLAEPDPLIGLLMQTRVMRRFHPDLGREARQAELARYNSVIAISALEQYDPYIEAIVGDVKKMARVASACGCRTLVAIPPWRSPALLPGAVERLAGRLRSTFARSNDRDVRFIDSAGWMDEMNARGLWRPDGVHWDDRGNRVIAGHLTKAIGDAGFLD